MYTITHVDKRWIVCAGETDLITFDRKYLAVKAIQDAEHLLRIRRRYELGAATKPVSTCGVDPTQ